MSIILKSGNSTDLINTDGSGNVQVNVKAPVDAAGCVRINPTGYAGSYATAVATAAGNALPTITVPAGKKWLLKAIQLTATIANSGSARVCGVYCSDLTPNTIAAAYSGASAPINAVSAFTFAPSMPAQTTFVQANSSWPFPETPLGPGFVIHALEAAGVVGDSIKLLVSYIEYDD